MCKVANFMKKLIIQWRVFRKPLKLLTQLMVQVTFISRPTYMRNWSKIGRCESQLLLIWYGMTPYKHRLPAASGSGTTFGFIRKHCIILRVAKFFIKGCVALHWTKSIGGEELFLRNSKSDCSFVAGMENVLFLSNLVAAAK